MHRWIAVGLLGLAAVVAGCGGGGGGGSTLPSTGVAATSTGSGGGTSATSNQRAATSFTIKIPGHAQTASNLRKPAYISPSTQGVEIDLIASASPGPTQIPQLTASLSPSSSACTTPGPDGSYSCSVSAFLPVGTNQYVVALLDQTPKSGPPSPPPFFPTGTNVLSYATVSFTVANNTTNKIPLTLNGLIAGFAISPSLVTVPSGTATSVPVTVTAYDADSNIIVGPGGYDVPLVVSVTDSSNSLTFAGGTTTVSLASPGPPLTLNYNGGPLVSGVVNATAHGLSANANVVPAAANAVTVPLPAGGASVPLVAVGGIRTYVVLPPNNAAAGTQITLGSQLSPPSGTSSLSTARKPQAVVTPTPSPTPSAVPLPTVPPGATALQYIVMAPTNPVTFTSLPSFQFTGTFDSAQSYYVAEFDPTNPSAGYVTIEGPGVLSSGTLSFTGTATSLTVAGGLNTVFALLPISTAPTPVPTASVGVGVGIPGAPSQALYVTDSSSLQISRFGSNVLGNVAPTWSLPPTSDFYGIAFGPNATMIVTVNGRPGVVQKYAPVPSSTSGAYNTTPFATISGTATGLSVPYAVNTDTNGNIYVDDLGAEKILEFTASASGNVAPISTLSGSNTGIAVPFSVVLDQSNDIWVLSSGTGSPAILEFAPGSNGNVAPIRTIAGSNTGLTFPYALTLDYAGDVIVTDYAPGTSSAAKTSRARLMPQAIATSPPSAGAIYVFAPGASGNVAPARIIVGSGTGIVYPASVASDGDGNIDITAGSSIEVFAPGANGNAAPIKVISGSATGLNSPLGIAISPVQP